MQPNHTTFLIPLAMTLLILPARAADLPAEIRLSYPGQQVVPVRPILDGPTIRMFLTDAKNAADVADVSDASGLESISDGNINPVAKMLLPDFPEPRHGQGIAPAAGNMEGITLGPVMNGRETPLLVSGNNFSNAQFDPVPEPREKAMLLAGLALIGMIVRRGRYKIE